MQSIKILIALGSNLGDRHATLAAAVDDLRQAFTVTAVSPFYDTEPQYVTDQPPFLNAVVVAETGLGPLAVLDTLQGIENAHGRVRVQRHGPRTLDLDLLAYGAVVMGTERLTLPHPGMHERMFVLQPLCDIWPDWRHPVNGETAAGMLGRLRSL